MDVFCGLNSNEFYKFPMITPQKSDMLNNCGWLNKNLDGYMGQWVNGELKASILTYMHALYQLPINPSTHPPIHGFLT